MLIERRLKPQIHVDLTPLIDVVFQLVIFFMISSVFNTAPGIPLVLPESASSESVTVTEIRLTLISEQELYLNKDLYSLEGLSPALEALQVEGAEDLSVVVEGGQEVSYQLMISVLDLLRNNGFTSVNLITREGPGA